MAKASALERLLRRGLLILLVGLTAAIVYLWLSQRPSINEEQVFGRIYQASASRASNDLKIAKILGLPIHYSRQVSQYEFYYRDGHHHIRFQFPIAGPHGRALIRGTAVLLGKNWLVVTLVATFPGRLFQINLTPGIYT
ncbi:MAG: hypothetical protein L0I62_04780 [Gammaproteobacteria bacterium]|nr:hypothetical protein [Gammaproteobacteria bacterium]